MNKSAPIAIVTGGSRGLGRSSVLSLGKRASIQSSLDHANEAEAEMVVSLVAEEGRKAAAQQLDAGNIGSFDAFVDGVRSALGARSLPFEKTTEDELDSLYNVHFKGVFFLTSVACSRASVRASCLWVTISCQAASSSWA